MIGRKLELRHKVYGISEHIQISNRHLTTLSSILSLFCKILDCHGFG